MVLAESQKYVLLGDQHNLTFPVVYCIMKYLYALYRVGMGRKQLYLSVLVLFKCVSDVEGRSCWYTFNYG